MLFHSAQLGELSMADVTLNGIQQQPISEGDTGQALIDRLRTIVQDCHLNFLIGAGSAVPLFPLLGNIEQAMVELDAVGKSPDHALVRASIQGYFFKNVLLPNLDVVTHRPTADEVLGNYSRFLRTLNRILLKRRSSLLTKQINLFTTNVDLLFEVALEGLSIDYCDGFNGKLRPRLDLGEFNTLRYRAGNRYEQRSEVPVFNLLKLHGSAGWLQDVGVSGSDAVYFDHGLSRVAEANEAFNSASAFLLSVLEADHEGHGPLIKSVPDLIAEAAASGLGSAERATIDGFTRAYDCLGIVNPDKQKFATTVLNETYYELIRRFSNELEKENSVLFVHGFSFRDEHLRDLVLRAARTNPTLQVIIFCHGSAGRERYEQLLPDPHVKNGNIEYVTPPPADGEAFERKISLAVLESEYLAPVVADRARDSDQRLELDIRVKSETQNDA